MSSPDPAQPKPEPPQTEAADNTSIILTDTVMAGVIRESVRRHVPVVQVVAERRHEIDGPHAGDPPRSMTAAVPVRRTLWSRCLRWFRK